MSYSECSIVPTCHYRHEYPTYGCQAANQCPVLNANQIIFILLVPVTCTLPWRGDAPAAPKAQEVSPADEGLKSRLARFNGTEVSELNIDAFFGGFFGFLFFLSGVFRIRGFSTICDAPRHALFFHSPGLPDPGLHHIIVNSWEEGITSPQNVVLVSIASTIDPSLAPPGKHTLHAYLPATEPFDIWKGASLK
jgi:hypothetical protein